MLSSTVLSIFFSFFLHTGFGVLVQEPPKAHLVSKVLTKIVERVKTESKLEMHRQLKKKLQSLIYLFLC